MSDSEKSSSASEKKNVDIAQHLRSNRRSLSAAVVREDEEQLAKLLKKLLIKQKGPAAGKSEMMETDQNGAGDGAGDKAAAEAATASSSDDDDDHNPHPEIPYPKLAYDEDLRHSLMISITTCQAKMLQRVLETMDELHVTTEKIDKWCPLIITCAEKGNCDCLNVMLRYYKDITVTSPHGTLLHASVRAGNFEMVQRVLDLGVDVMHKAEVTETTALFDAVRYLKPRKEASVNGDTSASISSGDSSRASSCVHQPRQYDFRIIQALLDRGCDVNEVSKDGRTVLHIACLHGQRALVEFLLKAGADPTMQDQSGHDAFMNVMYLNHQHLMPLVYRDVTQEQQAKYLQFAAEECSGEVMKFLLSKGYDPLLTASDKAAPLITTVTSQNTSSLRVLARTSKESFECVDQDDRSALYHALNRFHDDPTPAEILIDNGANVDAIITDRKTGLLAMIDNFKIVEFLIGRGANPDFIAPSGLYPILAACALPDEDEAVKTMKLLLKTHVDMTSSQMVCSDGIAGEYEGLTPLQVAIQGRKFELTLLLLAADASLNKVHDWLSLQMGVAEFAADRDEKWTHLFSLIRERSYEPMGLKGTARMAVLKLLGHRDVEKRIKTLELPTIMEKYLMWEDYIRDRTSLLRLQLQEIADDSRSA